jgi:hypothetical protein
MKNRTSNITLGVLLIGGGLLFLLMNFNIIPPLQPLIWASLFGLGGLGFLSYLITSRAHWWPVIPGLTLLGLSALIALETLFPTLDDTWGASIFMGSIALAFWIIYAATGGSEWWAIIPGGTLFTIALVIIVSESMLPEQVSDDIAGGVFMLGLSLTFGLVYLLPSGEQRQRWALIPAGILLVIGLFIAAAAAQLLAFIAPILLILIGIYLVIRTARG